MVNLLTRDAILGASDIKTEDVSVPEWGGTVRVKGLTAAQRDQVEAKAVSARGSSMQLNLVGMRAHMAALAIVGEDGKALFTQADITALGEKSGAALDRVFEVVTRLSGMSDNDVEELTKNSEADQSDDSPSA